jgi:hypothetical protein
LEPSREGLRVPFYWKFLKNKVLLLEKRRSPESVISVERISNPLTQMNKEVPFKDIMSTI